MIGADFNKLVENVCIDSAIPLVIAQLFKAENTTTYINHTAKIFLIIHIKVSQKLTNMVVNAQSQPFGLYVIVILCLSFQSTSRSTLFQSVIFIHKASRNLLQFDKSSNHHFDNADKNTNEILSANTTITGKNIKQHKLDKVHFSHNSFVKDFTGVNKKTIGETIMKIHNNTALTISIIDKVKRGIDNKNNIISFNNKSIIIHISVHVG